MDEVKDVKREKFERSYYKYWLQRQCEKAGGHTYTMRMQWGIAWVECICCGKRLKKGEKVEDDIEMIEIEEVEMEEDEE